MRGIHTIELNLDDDFASSCSYHVDDLMTTIKRNIAHAQEKGKTDRWVLIGLANSLKEAIEKSVEIQSVLCEINGLKPYRLEKSLNEWIDEISTES